MTEPDPPTRGELLAAMLDEKDAEIARLRSAINRALMYHCCLCQPGHGNGSLCQVVGGVYCQKHRAQLDAGDSQ